MVSSKICKISSRSGYNLAFIFLLYILERKKDLHRQFYWGNRPNMK